MKYFYYVNPEDNYTGVYYLNWSEEKIQMLSEWAKELIIFDMEEINES